MCNTMHFQNKKEMPHSCPFFYTNFVEELFNFDVFMTLSYTILQTALKWTGPIVF